MSDVQSDFERTARRNTQALQNAFDKVCQDNGVYQGDGPPVSYFQTIGHSPKRFVYISFGMSGEKAHGEAMVTSIDVGEVLRASVETFTHYLTPNRTLVWRSRPEVDVSDDGTERWASYWRCVQLDDEARQMEIIWHL